MDSTALGIAAPPVGLRVKLLRGARYVSLFVQAGDPVSPGTLVDWLAPYAPLRVEFGSRGVIRADFDPLPLEWSRAFLGVEVDMISIETDGATKIAVRGTRSCIAAFSRRSHDIPAVDVRSIFPTSPLPFLTTPQDQALRAAVSQGYYRIPRPLNLHDLAKQLHISAASLSERLRRAEGRVITRYVEEGGVSPWDAKTLFDAHDLEPDDALEPFAQEAP
jgi:AraC-like DNA-binding protein